MSDSKTDQQQSTEKAPDVQQVQPIRVRIIPADTTLQQKTGVGGIDGALVNLASIILNFLEQLKDIDSDALEIMVANHKTLRIIISKQMRGTGGSYGRKLEEEVHDVCIRYMKRREV